MINEGKKRLARQEIRCLLEMNKEVEVDTKKGNMLKNGAKISLILFRRLMLSESIVRCIRKHLDTLLTTVTNCNLTPSTYFHKGRLFASIIHKLAYGLQILSCNDQEKQHYQGK